MKSAWIFVLLPSLAFGQGIAISPQVALKTVNGVSSPLANATITVCGPNVSGIPCSPALSGGIYRDTTLTTPLSNPFTADSNGNYNFVVSTPGQYTVTVTGSGFAGYSYQVSPSGIAIVATTLPGAEIGAQVNFGIAAIGCGEIVIPSGVYPQRTTIVKPRCVKLRGASSSGTYLNWTPVTGVSIVSADSTAANAQSPEGSIEDLTILGPGFATTTCGIYVGGSDGTGCGASITGIDPPTNFGDHDNLTRVRVGRQGVSSSEFGVGIQWGNNAWSNTIFMSSFLFNGIGVYIPATVSNTGENISFIKTDVQNNNGIGIQIDAGNNINFVMHGGSLDFNGPIASCVTNTLCTWQLQNGTSSSHNSVSLIGVYMAAADHWIQNYGYMSIVAPYFTGGQNSGTLGYLIDNESQFMNIVAGQTFNSGTGALVNPAGFGPNVLGTLTTGSNSQLPVAGAVIDNTGDLITTQSVFVADPHFGSNQHGSSQQCELNFGPTTLNTGGTATNTGQNCLLANSIIDAVVYRITTTITTAANFTIGDSGSATRYCGTQSTLTAGTTGLCLAAGYYLNSSATPIKITTNVNPGAGAIRVIVYSHTWTPPTS